VAWVSESGFRGAKDFKYRLSTGACWNGAIEHGRVVIRLEGLAPQDVTVLKPVNRFQKKDSQWEWEFESLKPTLADDLVVQAAPGEQTFAGRTPSGDFSQGESGEKSVTFVERDGKWYARHANYSVRASSTLPPDGEHRYDAANVANGSRDSVWSEGVPGNGIGEWLELTLDVPKPLTGLDIWPGHYGSLELFKANARPKRIEVLVNDEHRFETTLEDRNEDQFVPVIGYEKPAKKVRITIKEVYPGAHYEDLCISHIGLETRLNKKPKLAPSR
jgi:hypothetical protein